MSDPATHLLRERVKELTLLHATARLLQDHTRSSDELLHKLAEIIPAGWQYPEITGARIQYADRECRTPNFSTTPWIQSVNFDLGGGRTGTIEICYCEPRPTAAEGPFLAEERELLNSLGELVRLHLLHRESDEALRQSRDVLEHEVAARTRQLELANQELQRQIEEQRRTETRIREYQQQLTKLSLELSLTEARERREIAADLHDHIGQALAFVKLRVSQFRGNAVFCGFEDSMGEIIKLLDQTIAYTRNLTLQISPPVLYEFGLPAAIEWLAESFAKEHEIPVTVVKRCEAADLSPEFAAQIFKSIKELLTNAVKHSGGTRISISMFREGRGLHLQVSDNGRGCDVASVLEKAAGSGRYGLFSVRERMRSLGGDLTLTSVPNSGTTAELVIPEILA